MLIICKSDVRPPTAPVLGTIVTVGASSLQIPLQTAATDNAAVASYALERATSAGGTYSVISSSAAFPYTDSGLAASTTYYYRAAATDSSGNVGNYSAIVSGTTSSSSGVTGNVVNFVVSFQDTSGNVITDIDYANIYRGATFAAATLIGDVRLASSQSTYAYTDSTAPTGQTNTYWVTVVRSDGVESAPSGAISRIN